MPDNAALTMPNPGTDPSGKPRPALSATQDLPPIIAPKEVPSEKDASPPEPAPAGAEPPAPPASSSEPEKKDETPPWMKAELTKERNRRRQAERLAGERDQQLATALEALKSVQPKAEPKTEPDTPRPIRPRREGFDSPVAYETALDEYEVRLADWAAGVTAKQVSAKTRREIEETQRKDREEAQKKHQGQVAQAIRERWEQGIERATEKYPDWEDVARADDVQITEPMAATLMQIENGPEVAYYLGKHKTEAARIAQMGTAAQAVELGRIVEKMNAPAKPEVSRAPPPIKPLRSANGAVERGLDELSMDEYAQKALIRINPARAKQLGYVK